MTISELEAQLLELRKYVGDAIVKQCVVVDGVQHCALARVAMASYNVDGSVAGVMLQ